MNPYAYEGPTFWVLLYLWFALEILFAVRARRLQRGQPKKENHDGGSVALIVFGMYSLILASISVSVNRIGVIPAWTQYIGFVLMLVGMAVRYSAIVQLGRFFSPLVGVVSNQEIVQSGLYRFLRHPSYTGGWITAVGIGFGLKTWWAILLCGMGLFLIYAYRIHVEEKALVQHFGDQYVEYRRRTWRMIPGIW